MYCENKYSNIYIIFVIFSIIYVFIVYYVFKVVFEVGFVIIWSRGWLGGIGFRCWFSSYFSCRGRGFWS